MDLAKADEQMDVIFFVIKQCKDQAVGEAKRRSVAPDNRQRTSYR
jgi:hypothetical protein